MTDRSLLVDRSRNALAGGARRSAVAALGGGVAATGSVSTDRRRLVHLSCT
ncbi:hypothetical protein [Halorubrum sp. HHNYT27]|uniref:hypothetical protein n=1 Tax=Halorubrum sp. HHNYT27 TaxID=3402275 RepID=UPI003EC02178